MSEVVISRRGGSKGKGVMITEYITESKNWKVPKNIVDNKVEVLMIGGGAGESGSSRTYRSYASGFVNNGTFILNSGDIIPITVGLGYDKYLERRAGSTSFGTYLSANCGSYYGTGGAGGSMLNDSAGGSNLQFGGGLGVDGGPYGGGGGGGVEGSWAVGFSGGNGGYYGGGGGAGGFCLFSMSWYYKHGKAGNGGYYGGGGGLSILANLDQRKFDGEWTNIYKIESYGRGGYGGHYNYNGKWKQSGYGGNGTLFKNQSVSELGWIIMNNSSGLMPSVNNIKNQIIYSENGTNTLGIDVAKDNMYNTFMNGKGLKGKDVLNVAAISGGSGGGGYGGNGGNSNNTIYPEFTDDFRAGEWWLLGGGGGGGYGSNGEDATSVNGRHNDSLYMAGGGGGGYGGDGNGGGGGGYGKVSKGGPGGGGGYYCPWRTSQLTHYANGMSRYVGGGGAGIGIWDGENLIATYGGGAGVINGSSEDGVCILKYYLKAD